MRVENEFGDREFYYKDQSLHDYGNLRDLQFRSWRHRRNIVTFVNLPHIFWKEKTGPRQKQRCKKMLQLRSSADTSLGVRLYSIDQITRRGLEPPSEETTVLEGSHSFSMGLFPSGGHADAANTLLSHLKGYRLRQAWKFEDLLGRGLSPTLYNYAVDKAEHSNIPLTQVISECANGYHDCRPRGFAAYQRSMCHHMSNPTDMECTRNTEYGDETEHQRSMCLHLPTFAGMEDSDNSETSNAQGTSAQPNSVTSATMSYESSATNASQAVQLGQYTLPV